MSRDDIRDITTASAFDKGERYRRQGRILSLNIADSGDRITAKVQGGERRPYSQTIEIDSDDGDHLQIEGRCSCPVGFNCKHVAAVLFEVIAGQDAAERADAPSFSRAPKGRPTRQPSPPADILAPDLAAWIDELTKLETSVSEDYPPDVRQRLIYVLDVAKRAPGIDHLTVASMSVRMRKDDTFSDAASRYDVSAIHQRNPAKFIRPSDREIAMSLHRMPGAYGRSAIVLTGDEGALALTKIIATGRARWRSAAGPVMTQGPARCGRIVWRLANDGSHAPDIDLEGPPGADTVLLTPPWYVDANSGLVGVIETGHAPRLAAGILSAPRAPARQLSALRAAIDRRLPGLSSIAPPHIAPATRIERKPVFGLRLMARDLPRIYDSYSWEAEDAGPTLLAHPYFRYDDFEIGANDPREYPTFVRDGGIFEVTRDRKAEKKARSRLDGLGFKNFAAFGFYNLPAERKGDLAFFGVDASGDWIDFLYRDLPALRGEGWEIDVEDDFPIRLVRPDGEIAATFKEGSGIDWLELDLGVSVDGERIDLASAILAAIGNPDFAEAADSGDIPIYVPLPDGRILAMLASRIQPIVAAIRELLGAGAVSTGDGRLRFSTLDAASIADLEAASADIVWRGGERIRELGRLLRGTGAIPSAALPRTFEAQLRPYQQRGVDWLQFLRSASLGGVLADDMGLGKTVQTLAHIAIEKANGRLGQPALVVAPTSLVANWRREAERFVRDLRVLTLHGPDRKARFGEIASHDLVLTTYPLLIRDHERLRTQTWSLLALDEAQTIKNPDAATTLLVGSLDASHRICLTGTPLENHLGELWSLFAFLSPGFLGDRRSFNRRWRHPIEKRGDLERQKLLARRVKPFLLRRTKAEVAADLPPKTEIVETIEMDVRQRALYDSVRMAMHDKVRSAIAARGFSRSRIVILDALLKLRQVCCDPRLLKLKGAETAKARSAKLERLMEMLGELVGEGRRILLFSQFTSMLALIEAELLVADIPHVRLTGDTHDRETPIRRFQAGEIPVFLISLKAGGLGLNLTAADTVIHYDPWWNPAVEDQATDRAHRIGQDKPVFVHKLMMLSSIEEKMETLKQRKRGLAAGLFDPDAGSAIDLTEADVEGLLGSD